MAQLKCFAAMAETGSDQFTNHFEWDPSKAHTNLTKHGVSFDVAATVFQDPLAATIVDHAHSADEERWVTIGRASTGVCIIVVHTWQSVGTASARIRLISGRVATKSEIRDYEEGHDA